MAKRNMIVWFIKELKLPNAAVAAIINTHPDTDRRYSSANVKQMMLGRQKWPENTWDALMQATRHEVSNFFQKAEILNELNSKEYRVTPQDYSFPFGRLGVIITCINLDDNISVLLS